MSATVRELELPKISQPTHHRNVSSDIAKGLLIVLVVLGHSKSDLAKYIYWFHMPAFFALSGYFFKRIEGYGALTERVIKLVHSLVIPYIVYLLLINSFEIYPLVRQGEWMALGKLILYLAYGQLVGINGTFWFIGVLFFTRILVSYLSIHLTDRRLMLLLLILFSVGTVESMHLHYFPEALGARGLPLHVDVVLVAGFYYFIGYLIRTHLVKIDASLLVGLLLVAGITIGGDYLNLYDFRLDMKNSTYCNPLFTLTIPIVFLLIILKLSDYLQDIRLAAKVFTLLSSYSIVIMYLHILTNKLLSVHFQFVRHPLAYTLLGVLVPVVFGILVKQKRMTFRLFFGKFQPPARTPMAAAAGVLVLQLFILPLNLNG